MFRQFFFSSSIFHILLTSNDDFVVQGVQFFGKQINSIMSGFLAHQLHANVQTKCGHANKRTTSNNDLEHRHKTHRT